ARLPPRLRRKVELVLRPAGDDPGHRTNGAGTRVDGDDRRRGIGPVVERVANGALGDPLEAPVDRRVDAQPAGLDATLAVALDELLAHEAEEVRLADARVQRSRAQVQLPVCNGLPEARRPDVAVLQHRSQNDVPA